SNGVVSSRDAWVYNSSKKVITNNLMRMIQFYEMQREKYGQNLDKIENNPKEISWSVNLKRDFKKGIKHSFSEGFISNALYRPFFKQRIYFERSFLERPGYNDTFFPISKNENLLIGIPGLGSNKGFFPLITNSAFDFQTLMNGLIFPLYHFEERQINNPGLFDAAGESEYIRRDGVSDFILERAKKIYGKNVSKEDIFYYVYGFLHSEDYRRTFANDLKKMLPRLPLVDDVRDFWKFSNAGRKLADLHLYYEDLPAYEGVELSGDSQEDFQLNPDLYKVQKMRFPKKDQKDKIIYNSKIVLSNIPEKAYEYIVNGKSAIEWIMERYQVSTDKKSGITNDPNDWAKEQDKPRYILDLLLSIINLSMQTVDIVAGLPKIEFEEIKEENVL
ncbi:MAG: helicase, partial [Bacteroidales bacterium]|nr:helicase [Bacteroidales bacterium]